MQAHAYTGNQQDSVKTSLDLAAWTLAWVATLALARFGPEHLWNSQTAASWTAIAVNLVVGVGWMMAHARYLHRVDELQRKIMMDAMVVTLGVGWVGGFAYVAATNAGLVDVDAEIGLFSALLGVVYMIAIAVGHLRFR